MKLVEFTLIFDGYTLLLPQERRRIKVLGPAKFPQSQGMPVYYVLADLPKVEMFASYFIPLKNISPQDAAQLFHAQVSPPKPYSSIVPVPNANEALVTGSTSVIRQWVGMQPLFDVPSKENSAFMDN